MRNSILKSPSILGMIPTVRNGRINNPSNYSAICSRVNHSNQYKRAETIFGKVYEVNNIIDGKFINSIYEELEFIVIRSTETVPEKIIKSTTSVENVRTPDGYLVVKGDPVLGNCAINDTGNMVIHSDRSMVFINTIEVCNNIATISYTQKYEEYYISHISKYKRNHFAALRKINNSAVVSVNINGAIYKMGDLYDNSKIIAIFSNPTSVTLELTNGSVLILSI